MSTTSPDSPIIVIDASLALWTVLPVASGETALEQFAAWRQAEARLVAPMFWLAEIVSAIRRSVYVGAVSDEEGRIALEDLLALEVDALPMDAPLCRSALAWAERLGQARAYDAFYLALAEQLQAEFWTADQHLANAAQQIGAAWVRAL
jgi:predicted nucleic acid-binding protein